MAQKWKAKAQANRLEVTVAPVSGDATILYMNKHTSTVHDTKIWMEKNAGTKRGCQVLVDVAGNELHGDTLLRAVAGCGDRSLELYQLLKEEGNGNIDVRTDEVHMVHGHIMLVDLTAPITHSPLRKVNTEEGRAAMT